MKPIDLQALEAKAFWVPENFIFSEAGICLDTQPDDGAATLVYGNAYVETLIARIRELEGRLTEQFFLEIITRWKYQWMNVTGTDERDRENYSRRAFGIDANMKYSLARMLEKAVNPTLEAKE